MINYERTFDASALTDAQWEVVRVNSLEVVSQLEHSSKSTTPTSNTGLFESKKNPAVVNSLGNEMNDNQQQQIEELQKQVAIYKKQTTDLASQLSNVEQKLFVSDAKCAECETSIRKERREKEQLAVNIIQRFSEKSSLVEFECNERVIRAEEQLRVAIETARKERVSKEKLAVELVKKHNDQISIIDFEFNEMKCNYEEQLHVNRNELVELQRENIRINANMVAEQLARGEKENNVTMKEKLAPQILQIEALKSKVKQNEALANSFGLEKKRADLLHKLVNRLKQQCITLKSEVDDLNDNNNNNKSTGRRDIKYEKKSSSKNSFVACIKRKTDKLFGLKKGRNIDGKDLAIANTEFIKGRLETLV